MSVENWENLYLDPVDGVLPGNVVVVNRWFFTLKEDGDADYSFKPQSYQDGDICEYCWLKRGQVHGRKHPWACSAPPPRRQTSLIAAAPPASNPQAITTMNS